MKTTHPYIRLVLEIALAAALIEVLTMRLLPWSLPEVSGWWEVMAHTMLLMLGLAPVVWWRSVRAFQRHARHSDRPTVALDAAGSLGLSSLVLIGGVLLSLWAGQRIGEAIEAQARDRFERLTLRVDNSIRQRFAMPLFGLRGAHGIHNASEKIDRTEFRNYVQAISIDEQFPGVRGFGYIVKVARTDLPDFVQAERADNAASFEVRTSGNAADLYVIKMLEPAEVNAQALGLDVGSEPVRRAGVLRAIDTGEPTLTGPIKLLQDRRQRPGVLYLLPLYQGSPPPQSAAQRRARLVGIYYAPIVIEELMQGLPDIVDRQLNIDLRDETGGQSVAVFTATGGEASEDVRRFAGERTLSIAGRQYVLRTQANAAFGQILDRTTPSGVVLGGALLSVLLALATWMLASARARTEAHAARLTEDLERLAQVARLTSNAVNITTPDLRITWVNEGFTRLYGYTLEEARGRTMRELVGTEECPAENLATLEATQAKGETCQVELFNRNKQGQTLWIDTEIQPRRNAQGQLLGYIEISQNVSALKEATRRQEAAQRETDALLQILNAHAIISITDRSGRLIEVNDAFCALTGYTRAELLGGNSKLNTSGVHSPDFWAELWQTITAGRIWHGEICNRAKSGALYWVDTIIVPWFDAHGEIEKFLAIRHDVTSRKLTEQQLRSSEAFLERVSRVAGVGGWEVSLATLEMTWSDQSCAIFDLPRDHRCPASDGLKLIDPAWRARLVDVLQEAQHHHKVVDMELPVFKTPGQPMWVRLVADFEWEGDQPMRLVGAVQDITAQRADQMRLRETTSLLTSVLHAASGVGVIATDADLVIRVFNTGAESLLQYRASEVVGQATPLLFRDPALVAGRLEQLRLQHGEVEPTPRQLLIDHAVLGQVRHIDYRRRDGSLVPVSIVVTEIRDEDGHVTGYLGIVQDRTESLAYETSLQQAKLVAEQASAAKGQFVANMSHEIRTPMNAILGMLRLLQKTDLNERQLDYASKAERAARSLLSLVNDILDFSKIEADKMSLHPRPFAVTRLLDDLHVVLSANLIGKPVALNLVLDPALPTYLMGDDLRLLQVLINLGGNAIKFTHQGQVNVTVQALSQDDEAVRLRISVRDTGIGISAQALTTIFEGFTQAEGSTTRQYGGTGLGLAISHSLVELMGGELRVHSTLGQGSTFWFDITLPRVGAEDTLPSSTLMPLDDLAPTRRLAGWRLLLVEDNPNNRQVANELLTDEGAEVSMAHNGEEGVQAVLNAPDLIDAVLMDVQMPVMDGLAATRMLRDVLGDDAPPVIAMTANALPADLAACEEAGMVAHVGKPFDLETLIATLLAHGRRNRTMLTPHAAARPAGVPLPTGVLPVAQAQGVALDEALARLGQRQDVYLRLLEQFCHDLPGAAVELREAWRRGNAPALKAWLHSFKGLAGTLGLRTLQTLAAEAEQVCPTGLAGQDTHQNAGESEPAWLQSLVDAMAQARASLPALQAALAPAASAPPLQHTPASLNTAALHQELQDLIKLLGRSDMGALDAWARMQAVHGAALAPDTLTPLNKAMDRLDFAAAIAHCQQLLTRWSLE